MRQIKRLKRATLVASAIFGLSQWVAVAQADERSLDVVSPETLVQKAEKTKAKEMDESTKTALERYEDKVTEETTELHILKTRQRWLPDEATIEKLNIDNRIRSQEKVIQLAEQEVQAEKDRIAEDKRKAEEVKAAEEARIAEEKRQAEDARIAEEAQLTEETSNISPVTTTASSITPTIVPTANTYPWGQCTWGVKLLADWVGPYWGNANQWVSSAAAEGFAVGDTPIAGSIIVFLSGAYGHVGYVTDVDANGNIQILESNYLGSQTIGNYRGWFNPYNEGAVKFIYPK